MGVAVDWDAPEVAGINYKPPGRGRNPTKVRPSSSSEFYCEARRRGHRREYRYSPGYRLLDYLKAASPAYQQNIS